MDETNFDPSMLTAQDSLSDPAHIRRTLTRQVERHLQHPSSETTARLVRLTLPIEPVDPLHWLQVQGAASKLYWAGRDDEAVVAAVGTADTHAGASGLDLAPLRQILRSLSLDARWPAHYYGGFRFAPSQTADAAWRPFGAYRFVLPRFELHQQPHITTLTCTLVLPRDRGRRKTLLNEIEALRFPSETLSGALPMPLARTDVPDADGWRRHILQALDSFEKTSLEKVVLARRVTFDFTEPVDPFLLLTNLAASTTNCFHFLFQPAAGTAFVGATPERLFRSEGRRLISEAIAGTRPRGDTPEEDRRLGDELLQSEKDRREHAYVRQSIAQTLRAYCTALELDDEPSEMLLSRGRHLHSGVRGTLRPDADPLDVLTALHPTPAVGGSPQAAALQSIRALEPFDRGWYAGPVGRIGADEAEFAVAIRSGLVTGRRLALFSGAGIVQGSEPEAEWHEIEHKIRNFIDVLGLEARAAQDPAAAPR